jgi:hypothetical protein
VTGEPYGTIGQLAERSFERFPDWLERFTKPLMHVSDVPRQSLQEHVTEEILPGVGLRSPERDDAKLAHCAR